MGHPIIKWLHCYSACSNALQLVSQAQASSSCEKLLLAVDRGQDSKCKSSWEFTAYSFGAAQWCKEVFYQQQIEILNTELDPRMCEMLENGCEVQENGWRKNAANRKRRRNGMTQAAEVNFFLLAPSSIVNHKLIPLFYGKRIQTLYIFRNDVGLYTIKWFPVVSNTAKY